MSEESIEEVMMLEAHINCLQAEVSALQEIQKDINLHCTGHMRDAV